MRILALTGDWLRGTRKLGSISAIRLGHPLSEIQKQDGFETLVTPHFSVHSSGRIGGRDFNHNLHDGFDVVLMQRVMSLAHTEVIKEAREAGQTILQDVDDWYFGLPTDNVAFYGLHPKAHPNSNVNTYRKALAASSGILASTPGLVERLGKFNERTYLTRNGIRVDDFDNIATYNEGSTEDAGEHPRLGWTGAIRWRQNDLRVLKGIVWPLMQRHKLEFMHGGHDDTYPNTAFSLMGIPHGSHCLARHRATPSQYPKLMADMHIGLIPLDDNPFNFDGKSCLKGLEMAAAGVPFIATASPDYRWLHDQGIGRVAKNPADWVNHIEELLDPEVRLSEARRQRELVREFDVSRTYKQWEVAITEARRVELGSNSVSS